MTLYMHHISGRLRIKSPALKHSTRAKKIIPELLHAIRAIERVAVNSVTGSCLIHCDASITCRGDILSVLSQEGYFNQREAITHDQRVEHIATRILSLLALLV